MLEDGVMTVKRKVITGVLGLGPACGSTLCSMEMAHELAGLGMSAAYVEVSCQGTTAYDIVSMDRRFKKRDFVDFFVAKKQGIDTANRVNWFEKINWVMHRESCEDKICDFTPDMSLAGNKTLTPRDIAGEYLVLDIDLAGMIKKYGLDEAWERVSADCFDYLIVVVDPLPSKVISWKEILGKIEELKRKENVIFLLNKNSKAVNRRELERFIGRRFDYVQDYVSDEKRYLCEYSSTPYFVGAKMLEMREISKKICSI